MYIFLYDINDMVSVDDIYDSGCGNLGRSIGKRELGTIGSKSGKRKEI